MSVGDEFGHCVDESLSICSAVGLVLCLVHKCFRHARSSFIVEVEGRGKLLLSSADDVTY